MKKIFRRLAQFVEESGRDEIKESEEAIEEAIKEQERDIIDL
ncbi:20089_t:CDS:1, partial [Racocetra persica]